MNKLGIFYTRLFNVYRFMPFCIPIPSVV